jgi:hypothetical protein
VPKIEFLPKIGHVPNRPPTLTCGSSRATQVVCAPCTTFSKLWNFSASSFPFSFTCTTLSVSASTICIVICSCSNVVLSECACAILVFSSSSSTIICVSCSWRGSNWACLSFLLIYIVFNSVCRVFISWVPFKRSVMLMVFCHCFNSCMEALIFSSCWSNCWTFSSSSKVVQICAVLSNSLCDFLCFPCHFLYLECGLLFSFLSNLRRSCRINFFFQLLDFLPISFNRLCNDIYIFICTPIWCLCAIWNVVVYHC